MATIKISDLHPYGFKLLVDSESYLHDLTNEEMNVTGGIYYTWFFRNFRPFYPPKLWV